VPLLLYSKLAPKACVGYVFRSPTVVVRAGFPAFLRHCPQPYTAAIPILLGYFLLVRRGPRVHLLAKRSVGSPLSLPINYLAPLVVRPGTSLPLPHPSTFSPSQLPVVRLADTMPASGYVDATACIPLLRSRFAAVPRTVHPHTVSVFPTPHDF